MSTQEAEEDPTVEVKEESQENCPEEDEVEGSEKVCLISKHGLLNIHVLKLW